PAGICGSLRTRRGLARGTVRRHLARSRRALRPSPPGDALRAEDERKATRPALRWMAGSRQPGLHHSGAAGRGTIVARLAELRLMAKVARLYYRDGLRQVQIT